MPAPAGSFARADITLIDNNTMSPLAYREVYLEVFSEEVGTYMQIFELKTDSAGKAFRTFYLPEAEGSYKYRASWKGDSQYKSDTSPVSTVKVVTPAE